mgnify:CR=1 FL=1
MYYFNYYVFFGSKTADALYSPIVQGADYSGLSTSHLWNKEMNNIIPALWYLMHLPRHSQDVIAETLDFFLYCHDEAHNIIPLPLNEKCRDLVLSLVYQPALIICSDDVVDTVRQHLASSSTLLGIVKVSELNNSLLHAHWKKLCDYALQEQPYEKGKIIDEALTLTTKDQRRILPLIPLANQFGYTAQIADDIGKLSYENNANRFMLAMRSQLLRLCAKLCERDSDFKAHHELALIENHCLNGIPLVITFPGIMRYQEKLLGRQMDISEDEQDIIDVIGSHRAIAKNAIYISAGKVSQEMFSCLAQMEQHCKDNPMPKSSYIWKNLKKLGGLLSKTLQSHEIDIVNAVSQITVFSDFPIGLAILPETSAPLCCFKPISYRPLTPLTRALQCEMTKISQVYIGRGKVLKIIIAECVDKTDRIRPYCDSLTNSISELVHSHEEAELVIEELHTVSEFKNMLCRNRHADILIVSAHGSYNIEENTASLVIGGKPCMMEDLMGVPPVVLLSACHVMPRGNGAVTVGDMFLRAGALTVLGTFIPVDVQRNAVLILRFFMDIFAVRDGWSKMRTIDEIWCHTVGTNSVHEILSSSEKLATWANTKKNGTFPAAEFKAQAFDAKVRATHAYEDTKALLRKLAYRDGIGSYFDSVIRDDNYFPESVFYQLIGFPENVFVKNSTMHSYIESMRSEHYGQ